MSIRKRVAEYVSKALHVDPVVTKGLRRDSIRNAGTEGLLSWLLHAAGEKKVGPLKARRFMWRNIHKPSLKMESFLGQVANDVTRHITPFEKAFIQKQKIPMGKGMYKEIERPSVLAPANKARDLAVPIILGVESEKLLRKKREQGHMDQDLRKKAAAKMLQLYDENKQHEKRARALQLLYKQAELGYSQVPRTYSELQEKVASLLNQDLDVVEKALELTGGNLNLMGQLEKTAESSQLNASENFQAAIASDL